LGDGLLDDVHRFMLMWDIDKCEERFLPYIAAQLGWDLDRSLDPYLQRKIVKLIMTIYKQKGTKKGIIAVIYLLMQINVTITDINDKLDGWRIGRDHIGYDTRIACGAKSSNMYLFYVIWPRQLAVSEIAAAHQIVTWMRPVHSHHRFVYPS
jgi:phage tail-like protein